MIPNKQRCETCDKCEKPSFEQRIKGQFPYCDEGDFSISPDLEDTIALVGCASHSSVQSSDQVLDELMKWIDDDYGYTEGEDWLLDDIMNHLKELRTQGSRDP